MSLSQKSGRRGMNEKSAAGIGCSGVRVNEKRMVMQSNIGRETVRLLYMAAIYDSHKGTIWPDLAALIDTVGL